MKCREMKNKVKMIIKRIEKRKRKLKKYWKLTKNKIFKMGMTKVFLKEIKNLSSS